MTAWALRFDPGAIRFDPPGINAPRDSRIRTICRSIDKLLDAGRKEWRAHWAKYFGPDRRKPRREAIVLVLKSLVTHAEFLTGNVYVDGPKSDRGCSIMWLAKKALIGPDRVKEVVADLKTALIERFDRRPVDIKRGKLAGQTIVRRLPKAQPRSEENGQWTAEPAIRCLDWKRIAEIFRCSGSLKLLRASAQKRRDREGREPVGYRQKLMEGKRAANRKRWLEEIARKKLTGPTHVGGSVGALYGKLTARATGALPTPEQPPVPAEILLAVQLEDARLDIINEWKAANARTPTPLPSEAEVRAEICRRVGIPPPKLE